MLLITGASGLLGGNLSLVAAAQGRPITLVTQRMAVTLPGATSIQADLSDPVIARRIVRETQPRWIAHCAAATNVDRCQTEVEETWRINVEMPRSLARAAAELKAGFLYISTDSVFDGRSGGYDEEDSIAPVNHYAVSKAAGEKAVQEELPGCLVARTNIYGWNAQNKMSLAEWVLGRLESNQSVPGFTDVHFSPISANELSEILCEMMDRNLKGVYHASGSEARSKFEFAACVAQTFGYPAEAITPSSIADSDLKVPRPKDTSLRTHKLSLELGRRLPDMAGGLARFKQLADSGFRKKLKSLITTE